VHHNPILNKNPTRYNSM